MNIGKAIKDLRTRKGITQKELASRANISANAMCAIERGASFPSQGTIDKICVALNITESALMFACVNLEDVSQEKREVFKALFNILIS